MVSARSLLIAAPALVVIVVAFILLGPSGSHGDVTARAEGVCANARLELEAMPEPTSVAAGLALEHQYLRTFQGETAGLQALAPQGSDSFRAGVADLQKLDGDLDRMVSRPDFVHLSLTLPGHPDRVPAWVKAWIARTHAVAADAETQFTQAGVPGCAKSSSTG